MPPKQSKKSNSDSCTTILRKLKSGEFSDNKLTPPQRRPVVEWLLLQGMTNHEIADLIGMSEKTISRDRQEIRRDNAMAPSPRLVAEFMGEYRVQLDASVSRLRRIERDPASSPTVRVDAAKEAVNLLDRFVARLHSLGYHEAAPSRNHDAQSIAEVLKVAMVIENDTDLSASLKEDVRDLIAQLKLSLSIRDGEEAA